MSERRVRFSVRCEDCEFVRGNRRALVVTDERTVAREKHLSHKAEFGHHVKTFDREMKKEVEFNAAIG